MINEQFYFLLEAYDRLGARIFGHTWTGNEIIERPTKSPDEVFEERQPLEVEIKKIDTKVARLQSKASAVISGDGLAKIDRQKKSLLAKRSDLSIRLSDLPTVNQDYKDRFAAYQRRLRTETCLFGALQKGETSAQVYGGFILRKELWQGTRGFKCYLELSLAVLPRELSGKRRGTIVFPKGQFENWLKGIRPKVIDDENPPSPYDLCVIYLREQAKGSKVKIKPRYLEEAQRQIPELSERDFLRAWAQEVPPSWKRRGRPPKGETL